MGDSILGFLKSAGGCLTYQDIVSRITSTTATKPYEVGIELLNLEDSGLVFRRDIKDPTRPVESATWCIKQLGSEEVQVQSNALCAEQGAGVVAAIILNPPLINDVGAIPSALGLVEALRDVVCNAEDELMIMAPYIGDLLFTAFNSCLGKLKGLRSIRVITEHDSNKQNERLIHRIKAFLPNLSVAYATKYVGGHKIRGAHAKFIIVDRRLAILGTFNFTEVHLLVDYDVGLILTGNVVRHLSEIFDRIWARINSENVSVYDKSTQ